MTPLRTRVPRPIGARAREIGELRRAHDSEREGESSDQRRNGHSTPRGASDDHLPGDIEFDRHHQVFSATGLCMPTADWHKRNAFHGTPHGCPF